ncbi:MAG TPA: hypothetical protein PLH05_02630, partial [Bacillota bacterium]|nr:hypothetical protein [Bacillota bacterium]
LTEKPFRPLAMVLVMNRSAPQGAETPLSGALLAPRMNHAATKACSDESNWLRFEPFILLTPIDTHDLGYLP